jgi:hypothetical protein
MVWDVTSYKFLLRKLDNKRLHLERLGISVLTLALYVSGKAPFFDKTKLIPRLHTAAITREILVCAVAVSFSRSVTYRTYMGRRILKMWNENSS